MLPRADYVVDASIAAKWHLHDETLFVPQALLLIDRYVNAEINLIAPDCIYYEVASAFRSAVRDGRITLDAATRALDRFERWDIHLVPTLFLGKRAMELATQFNHPIYDCFYMALAEQWKCPYIHADLELHEKLAGRFTHELWVGNYQ